MKVVFPYPQPYGLFPDIYEYVEHLRKFEVDTHYIGWRPEEPRFPFLQQLVFKIKETNPDIVHVFYFRGSGLLPLLVHDKGTKWILDVRTIHVENKQLQPESRWRLKTRITWMESLFYDHISALTPTIRKLLQPNFRPITLVPLGASAQLKEGITPAERVRRRKELGIPLDGGVFLYAGSLSPSRQIDYLIRSFAKLYYEEGFRDAFFLIVGGVRAASAEKEKEIMGNLKKLCSDLGITHRVVFTGWITYPEVLSFYPVADIGIAYLPKNTPYEFQPPTKLIEYMMAGLLPLGNDVPSIKELIEEGQSGILCGHTIEELTKGMKRSLMVLSQTDIATIMRQKAREKVKDRDWNTIVNKYVLPVYRDLL